MFRLYMCIIYNLFHIFCCICISLTFFMMKYDSPINYYFNNYILRRISDMAESTGKEKPQVPASVFTGLRRNQAT